MDNGNTPAAPLSTMMDLTDGHIDEGYLTQKGRRFSTGLTKRETMAIAAMQGICGTYDPQFMDDSDARVCAKFAIDHADALLKALDE